MMLSVKIVLYFCRLMSVSLFCVWYGSFQRTSQSLSVIKTEICRSKDKKEERENGTSNFWILVPVLKDFVMTYLSSSLNPANPPQNFQLVFVRRSFEMKRGNPNPKCTC
mmetsp:Transcript_45207/g.109414  ORF Transcript_45207/g.109414 Transcript_45207/m.109414 type:complete len:109 (+) Transcript_45207:2891-3217(+)